MARGGFVLDRRGEDDLLREALQTVRDQSAHMQRAVDRGDQEGVLKHAAEFLRELRTSLLSPKHYYHLFMQLMDEMRHFETYVEDEHEAGASMQKLYERVQSSGNVVPRLYLLVAVGAVYIKSQEVPARDVLSDLVEMLKGVQHPLRGLFLRHYLSLRVRDKLPDTGSVYEQAGGGTVRDAIGFLVQNLRETNRLWIRLKNQNRKESRPVGAREKERMELRLLVGTSLVRLSQLEGVTLCVYTDHVLPRLLDDIVLACKDAMAQQYLMDCIVQVFPDEFHLHNLAKVLTALEKLSTPVDVALTLTALFERLTRFQEARGSVIKARGEEEGTKGEQAQENLRVFKQLLATTSQILLHPSRYHAEAPDDASQDTSAHVHVASALALFVTFASFILTWLRPSPGTENPSTTAAVQQVGTLCLAFLDKQVPTWRDESFKPMRQRLTTQLQALTSTLFHALSIPDLMHVPALVDLIAYLPWQGARKDVALALIRVLLARHERVHDATQMTFLLQLLAPLIRDDPTALPSPSLVLNEANTTTAAFANEQHNLAKTIHLLRNDQLDVRFQSFIVARRAFLQGGVFRMRFTLVPLMYQSLALAHELALACKVKTHGHCEETKTNCDRHEPSSAFDTTPHQVLQFTHEIVTAVASKHDALSVSCVHLFLQCALVADRCGFDAIAYEFITQAFIVYEDQITRARDQWRALELMVASLRVTCNLSNANYEILATKTTQYAARLLKKKDQVLMVLKCAHLFWHPCQLDGKRVRECLQRSLRIADALKETSSNQVSLFLDIFEAYLYFYVAQTPEVTHNYLVGLLTLVKDNLENMEHGQLRREGEGRYRAIVRYMDTMGIMDDAMSTSSSSSSR